MIGNMIQELGAKSCTYKYQYRVSSTLLQLVLAKAFSLDLDHSESAFTYCLSMISIFCIHLLTHDSTL